MILKGMNIEDYFLSLYTFDEIEKYILALAKQTKTPVLSPVKARILTSLIKLKKPEKVFEIGLGIGFSTYSILKALENNTELISIDKNFHRVDLFYEKVYKKFSKLLKEKLTVYPLDCFYVLEIFLKQGKKFDFIFVDSQKRDYPALINLLEGLIEPEGAILIDNITYNEQIYNLKTKRSEKYKQGIELVHSMNKSLSVSRKFHVSFIPAGDGMALLIKQ